MKALLTNHMMNGITLTTKHSAPALAPWSSPCKRKPQRPESRPAFLDFVTETPHGFDQLGIETLIDFAAQITDINLDDIG